MRKKTKTCQKSQGAFFCLSIYSRSTYDVKNCMFWAEQKNGMSTFQSSETECLKTTENHEEWSNKFFYKFYLDYNCACLTHIGI